MSDLARIVKLAELLVKQQQEVTEAEALLKKAKEAMLRTEREDLPTLMQEIGLQEMKLSDGQIVRLEEDLTTSITESTRPMALRWLLDNNFGGLIKTFVSVQFGRGEHDAAVQVRDELAGKYGDVTLKEDVHSSTLKSFVKEQLKAGTPVPFDLFNVFPFTKAVIRKK